MLNKYSFNLLKLFTLFNATMISLLVGINSFADVINVGNDTVEYHGVVYDYPNAGQSTWYYTVVSGIQPSISHVTWKANLNCLSVTDGGTWDGSDTTSLNSGAGGYSVGPDPTTGLTGVKFDASFGDNEERHYYFSVDGNYNEQLITFASKAGSIPFDTVEIPGPNLDCDGAQNTPPVAQDDNVNGAYNTSSTFDLLANDSDPDGDSLSAPTIFSAPANGTVVVNGDGTVTYTPDANFCGEDSFVYEISDGEFTDQAQVTVTITCPVNQPPVAVDDAFEATEDSLLLLDGLEGVLANDSDPDGDTLSASIIAGTGPSHGNLVLNPDGSFSYMPNDNYCGTDSFEYEVSDGNGGTDQALVTLNVACVNDPPLAGDDSSTTQENIAVNINVLSNDSDNPAENDPVFIDGADVSSLFGGIVTVNGDGSITYTPATGFAGSDSFSYQICDDPSGQPGLTIADSLCDTAIVTVTVAARYNRSIQVDLADFTLTGTALSGDFSVQNMSGAGKFAQLDEFKITAEYRDGNKWKPVSVDNCTFVQSAPVVLAPDESKTFNFSCETADDVSGYTVRVIANVHLFGRIRGSHTDGWYWERHSK